VSDDERDIRNIQPGRVMMDTHRCYGCGRHWAYEAFREGNPECPVCAGRTIKKLRAEIERLERSNRAMRASRRKAK
jgi:rubredoxin